MDHKIVCSSLIYFDVAEHETTENAYNKQDPRRELCTLRKMAAQREATSLSSSERARLLPPARCPGPARFLGAAPSQLRADGLNLALFQQDVSPWAHPC